MTAHTIEERLTAIEIELQKLKREGQQSQEQDKEAQEPRGWQRIGNAADAQFPGLPAVPGLKFEDGPV